MEDAELRYTIDIYEPDSTEKVWMKFSSPTPFQSINAGDLINPNIWPETGVHLLEIINMLRAVNVEHIIWESDDGRSRHTVLVYTQRVEETEEVRLKRKT